MAKLSWLGSSLMRYTVDFIDGRGRIDHFDLLDCRDDAEAGVAAHAALLGSRRADRVEVWDETRRVVIVGRTSVSEQESPPKG